MLITSLGDEIPSQSAIHVSERRSPLLPHPIAFSYGTQLGQPSYPVETLLNPAEELVALRLAARRAAERDRAALLSSSAGIYADPLSPLRSRDVQALTELFQESNMNEAEADIAHSLLVLWPAPCWEDDPSDFLQEFL